MATVFEVQTEDIEQLNHVQLTQLLKKLLHLEARSSGIAERAVDVGLNIYVPDGGEDGRIKWAGEPDSTDFLPCNLVQFQNKAKSMSQMECANEICQKDGKLKPMVEDVFANGGAYILFTTDELNEQEKKDRVQAIRDRLQSLKKPYSDSAKIDIYNASKIEGWVNKYASAIVAVLHWRRKTLADGLKTWEEWEGYEKSKIVPFVADEERENAITELKKLFLQEKISARIIGPSGLGKTRLALEAYRDGPNQENVSSRVVYADANVPNLPGLLSNWVRSGIDAVVVIDNCELSLHKLLKQEVEHPDSKLALLTLDYNQEKDTGTILIQLKQMSDKHIKDMLEPIYKDRVSDLDRIVSFAQGFPLMAVLLAEARLGQSSDMGSLTDDDILKRMVWGSKEPDKDEMMILQACSLFDKFGLDEAASKESTFIADEIAAVKEDDLFSCIKKFEGWIVNRAGRFAQIAPKPLAIRLAADWWRTTRPEKQQALIESAMPGQLIDSFCSQIAKLDFLPEVKELTTSLCGEQAPFGQAEVILSERGSNLFRALVEVNPEATSNSLYRILEPLGNAELHNISGEVRRNLVWALEKLCYHKEVFNKAAKCLLWLASEENEHWSNNATGQFLQLFRTFLSGTEATPEQRIALIDEALQSDNIKIRELAVKALDAALGTHGGVRTVGAEYQGSGAPLEEWRPKIWQEAFDYWEAAVGRLTNLALSDQSIKTAAKNSIATNIRSLMSYGRVELLDNSIQKIVEKDGPLWPKALDGIRATFSYDSKKMPEEGKNKLSEWVKLLTPKLLQDRIVLIVSKPSFEHEQDDDGSFTDLAEQRAVDFAKEISGNIESLIPHLNLLLNGEQRKAFIFGKHLVLQSGKWEPLLSESLKYLINSEHPNDSFVLGILNGIKKIDSRQWEECISKIGDIRELAPYYTYAVTTGTIQEKHLDKTISLIKENIIDAGKASTFAYGRALDHLDLDIVCNFVGQLSSISIEAAWIALDILIMFCHGNKQRWDKCKYTFKSILVDLPLEKDNQRKQIEMHHWYDASKVILKDGDTEFAVKLTERILKSCNEKLDFSDIHHYVMPVMRILIREYSQDVWPYVADAIKSAEPLQEYYLSQILTKQDSFSKKEPSVLADLPEKLFREWCLSEPDSAPLFVASTTDVYIEENETYTLSPRAKFIIDEFGDNKDVLSELSANMGSFGWSGSVVPIYKKELDALQPLIKHKKATVREWAERRISNLKKRIEEETKRDAEMEWGIR